MNQQGFTLMELLITVLILGILTSVALPQYMRSLERARATEAMTNIKALNDAVYAYAAGRSGENICPVSFAKLPILVEGSMSAIGDTITSKLFVYTINDAANAPIPGTDCPGVTATRLGGDKYDYIIWNPYTARPGHGATLACTGTTATSIAVCESLDMDTSGTPN